ncbi:MAG: hypothetical protein ACFB4I_25090 [Cyanophyceae cyanobacterium]
MNYVSSHEHPDQLAVLWQTRLSKDNPQYNPETRQSIVCWLLDGTHERSIPDSNQLVIESNRRYQILQQRYLNEEPTQAYTNLIERLNVLVIKHLSLDGAIAEREQQRNLVSLIQRTIQELLTKQSIAQKIISIAKHTADLRLRNAFLLAELEEYFLKLLLTRSQLFQQFSTRLNTQSAQGSESQTLCQQAQETSKISLNSPDAEESRARPYASCAPG